MSNRHQRRASLAAYRQSVGQSLLTWLLPPDTMIGVPVLDDAAHAWLHYLPTVAPSRTCICCRTLMHHRKAVGGLLLSVPALTSHLASVSAVCTKRWTEASIEEIEAATERTLSVVIPHGRLERRKAW
jgi:hypothetical protein